MIDKGKEYILYVDDNYTNLQLFEEFFSEKYHIITEISPKKAYKLLNDYPFKVIVSDQRMPEETGLSFLNRVHEEFPDIIKIICTAYVNENEAIQAVNQGGIFKYLIKPYSFEQMTDAILQGIREYNLRFENKRLLIELKKNNQLLHEALNKLQEHEKKLLTIFEQSFDGILIIQNDEVVEMNPAVYKILNYSCCDNIFYNSKIFKEKFITLYNQIISSYHANKSYFEISINIHSQKKYIEAQLGEIFFNGSSAILVILRDITDRKEQDNKILEAIISAQEDEKRKFSQELHDGLGPLLSTLKMYIEWLGEKSIANRNEILSYAIQLVNESISQTKKIANQLSPHILENFGLQYALQVFLDNCQKNTNLQYVFQYEIEKRLPERIELNLYRILTECIINTLKYAKASLIEIKISAYQENLLINYSDNGSGFDIQTVQNKNKGMGIFNIQSRVKLLNGTIQINTFPNKGFVLSITIPFPIYQAINM